METAEEKVAREAKEAAERAAKAKADARDPQTQGLVDAVAEGVKNGLAAFRDEEKGRKKDPPDRDDKHIGSWLMDTFFPVKAPEAKK